MAVAAANFCPKRAVYIHIIRTSKSLCVITETHDIVTNCWILQNTSGMLIYLTGNQNRLVLFCMCFAISFYSRNIFHTFDLAIFKMSSYMNKHMDKFINVTFVEVN